MTWRLGAAGLIVCVVGMAIGAAPPEAGAPPRVLFVACALVGSWISWRMSQRDGFTLRQLVGLAVLLRILAFPLLPSLSDDGYRYIWDGVLVVNGVSPYADLPSSDRFAAWHGETMYEEMNSRDYYSVYPPVSQAVFAAGGLVYPLGWEASWFAIKLAMVLLEGVGIACLARLAPRGGLALYALNPLPIIEIAGQGHTEGALVAALGVALVSMRRFPILSGAALSMAGWTKLFPFGLALALGRRWEGWAAFGVAGAIGAMALIPASGFEHVLSSIRLYGGTLDFYSAPFLVGKAALYPLLGEDAGALVSRLMSLGWMVVLLGVAGTLDGSARGARRSIAIGVVAYAVASPMQHPWNWVGGLYMIPLLQNQPWLVWVAGVSVLTYLRYVGVEFAYPAAVWIGWGGAAFVLIATARRLGLRQERV